MTRYTGSSPEAKQKGFKRGKTRRTNLKNEEGGGRIKRGGLFKREDGNRREIRMRGLGRKKKRGTKITGVGSRKIFVYTKRRKKLSTIYF
jgi:hypothetical protein